MLEFQFLVHASEFVSRRSSITRCRLSDIVKRRSFRKLQAVMSCVRHPYPIGALDRTPRGSISKQAGLSVSARIERASFHARSLPSQDGRPALDGLPSNERVFVRNHRRGEWALMMRAIKCLKGVRWMPWRREAMKDVLRCDKSRGAAKKL